MLSEAIEKLVITRFDKSTTVNEVSIGTDLVCAYKPVIAKFIT